MQPQSPSGKHSMSDSVPLSPPKPRSLIFSVRPSKMHTFRSVFSSISSVSALVLNPDLSLVSPSSIVPGNVSRLPEKAQDLGPTSNASRVALTSTSITDLSTSTVNRQLEWRCDYVAGVGPYAASCEDAVRHMAFIPSGSVESQEFRWVSRDWPIVRDVPLPQEVVSCKHVNPALKKQYQSLTEDLSADGHCNINVHLRGGSLGSIAWASQSQVKAGALAVIDNCMRDQAQPRGGTAKGISEH